MPLTCLFPPLPHTHILCVFTFHSRAICPLFWNYCCFPPSDTPTSCALISPEGNISGHCYFWQEGFFVFPFAFVLTTRLSWKWVENSVRATTYALEVVVAVVTTYECSTFLLVIFRYHLRKKVFLDHLRSSVHTYELHWLFCMLLISCSTVSTFHLEVEKMSVQSTT